MLIKDVCKLCHVTKKALVYYEDKGLISPLIMEMVIEIIVKKISRSLKKFVF